MGGRAKASKVTRELHATLEDLVKRVVDGELEPYKGAVAGQLIGVRLRLMEHERRVRHGDELEERLAALEGLAAQHKGSPRAVR